MPTEVIVALSVFGVMVLIVLIVAVAAAVSSIVGEKTITNPDDD